MKERKDVWMRGDQRMSRAVVALVAVLFPALFLLACDAQELSGKLTIAGSTTVLPINQECANILMERNPDLRITVSGGGSGHGIKAVGAGDIDIGAASRDIKEEEWKRYPDLNPFVIAKDGVAIIVNTENDINELTTDEISKIFAGEIKNWKEVGGKDAEIRVITREVGSGTRETFEKFVMKPYGREMAVRASVKPSNGEVKATVATDRNAIGYISLGHVDESVKALKIDGVEPTVENVLSGRYPLSRNLYLITKGEPSPLEKAFIDFVLSTEGREIVEKLGFIPVTTPTPTASPSATQTSTPTPTPTPTPAATQPGYEAIFFAATVLFALFLVRRKR